jgi:four helix bundle protein
MDDNKLSFEDLEVWQDAVSFSIKCLNLIERIGTDRKHYRLIEQFESAATSPALNIAEGKGRFSKKEFIQFLYIARGSLFETVSLLEIFRRLTWVEDTEFEKLKQDANRLGKRLSTVINSIKATSKL